MVAAASVDGLEASANVLYDFDVRENVKNISIPSLYVVGKYDQNVDAMRKFVPECAPGAKLVEIEEAGHLPMMENVEEFVESIEGFLGL